jgi:hypothetical protein
MGDIMIDEKALAVLLDRAPDFIDQRLAWCDVTANTSYIRFQNAEGNFHEKPP